MGLKPPLLLVMGGYTRLGGAIFLAAASCRLDTAAAAAAAGKPNIVILFADGALPGEWLPACLVPADKRS